MKNKIFELPPPRNVGKYTNPIDPEPELIFELPSPSLLLFFWGGAHFFCSPGWVSKKEAYR